MKKAIPILGLLGLGTWFFSYRQQSKNKKAANTFNLVPIGITGSIDSLTVNFQITNATEKSLTIDSLTTNVYTKGNAIGGNFYDKPFTIKPTNNSIIKLSLDIPTPEIYYQLKEDIANKNIRFYKFQILGSFKYKGLLFPIDREVNYYATK